MLSISNLSVDYFRRGETVSAIRDLSFSMETGEVVGLVGESGSGKSTIGLAILRLIRPQEGRVTSGEINFDGTDLLKISEEAMRRIRGQQIAMIFQDPFTALNPVLTIRRQMTEVLEAHRIVASPRVCEEALEQVQLEPERVLASYPHQLSGGQRQRVLIATALLGRPRLLLADEPTTALDVLVQRDILDLLFRLQRDLKLSVLLISHNLALVAQFAQRLIVLKEGRVVETGTPKQLFSSPQQAYTRELIAAIPQLEKNAR
jgi:ABC-type dipeptide/oligopeptide/nickel transport system ATPase component